MPSTEDVPSEPKVQPKINDIIALLTPGGAIDNAEKAQQEGMSALGKLYQGIEKNLQGNRAAVAQIRKMQKMSADKRADYVRTLEPLLVRFKYTLDDIDPDLADMAGADGDDKPNDDDDGGTGGEAGPGSEEEDEPADPPAPSSNSGMSALENARAHLGGPQHDATEPKKADPKLKGHGKLKLGIASSDGLTSQ